MTMEGICGLERMAQASTALIEGPKKESATEYHSKSTVG